MRYWFNAAVSIHAYGWLAHHWKTLQAHGLVRGELPYVDTRAKRAKACSREAKNPNVRPAKAPQLSLQEQLANARSLMQRSHPDKSTGSTEKFIKAKRLYDSIKRKLPA